MGFCRVRAIASRGSRAPMSDSSGPGPELTGIGRRMYPDAIARTLENPTAPMPSYRDLPPEKFNALVDFLARLR